MTPWIALLHLLLALLAGSLIGVERTYRGRAAGFRTYALVCLASSMLMVATSLPAEWLAAGASGMVVKDPTRVVQGIMTGIGFLGAGVIVKEGFNVRGLTTAASIWVTAAIGVLIGAGLLIPGLVAMVLTVGTMSVFRLIEHLIPSQRYLQIQISFRPDQVMSEHDLRQMLADHSLHVKEVAYDLGGSAAGFTYEVTVWSHHDKHARRLVPTLLSNPSIVGLRISHKKD